MIGRPENVGTRLQDLTIQFGAEVMRSLQRYNEFVQGLASGELDDTAAREQWILFLRDETERYYHNLADVSTGYYEALFQLASRYNPPFFENALMRNHPGRPSPGPAVQTIDLRAPIGHEAVSEFRVQNTTDREEDVSFSVSEFTGAPGAAPFRPPLRLNPPRFVLGPFESQVVRISLPLAAGLFVPNHAYAAVIKVQKREPVDFTVNAIAIAPAEDARG